MGESRVADTYEARLVTLENQDEGLREALHKFESKLDLILAQVSKIAVLEANHTHHSSGLDRAFVQITTVDRKLDAHVEVLVSRMGQFEEFMNKTRGMAQMAYLLWGAFGAGLALIFVKVMFFMSSHGGLS
jgi:hypothetical protein